MLPLCISYGLLFLNSDRFLSVELVTELLAERLNFFGYLFEIFLYHLLLLRGGHIWEVDCNDSLVFILSSCLEVGKVFPEIIFVLLAIALNTVHGLVVAIQVEFVLFGPVGALDGVRLRALEVLKLSRKTVQRVDHLTSLVYVALLCVHLEGVREVHLDVVALRGGTLLVQHSNHFLLAAFLG